MGDMSFPAEERCGGESMLRSGSGQSSVVQERVRVGEPCVGRNASHSGLVTPLQHFSAPTGGEVCAGCLDH